MNTKPVVGGSVRCPPDRGDSAYQGVITWVGTNVSENSLGVKYRYVEVQHPAGRKSMWPSNRLGFKEE